MRVALATHNPGKAHEFQQLLGGHVEVITLDELGLNDEIEEPGPTFEDNAMAKAKAVFAATGMATVGDDSGIEIFALNGWPGPKTARWTGRVLPAEEACRALLDEADRLGLEDRRMQYVCVLAAILPGYEPFLVRGTCEGVMVEPRGQNGFAHDRIIYSPELGKTFGEATDEEKGGMSHRARAVQALLKTLQFAELVSAGV